MFWCDLELSRINYNKIVLEYLKIFLYYGINQSLDTSRTPHGTRPGCCKIRKMHFIRKTPEPGRAEIRTL